MPLLKCNKQRWFPWVTAMRSLASIVPVLVTALILSVDSATARAGENGSSSTSLGWFKIICPKSDVCAYTTSQQITINACGVACIRNDRCRCAQFVRNRRRCVLYALECSALTLEWDPEQASAAIAISRRSTPSPGNPGSSTLRCGTSWEDANSKCNGACPNNSNEQCQNGLSCWSTLSLAPCNNNGPSPSQQPPTSRPPTQEGTVYRATMTNFDRMGMPYGGCGVPEADMVDSNGKAMPFVALNTLLGFGDGATVAPFAGGRNCGRWIRVTIKTPCGGNNDGSNMAECLSNWGSGTPDFRTGKVLYAYVADSCSDTNSWCRRDEFHLDISSRYLQREGIFTDWRNPRVEWQFLDSTPPGWQQNGLRIKWCKNAELHWLCFIVINTDNGVSKVDVLRANRSWVRASSVVPGNQFAMPQSWGDPNLRLDTNGGKYTIRPFSSNGIMYGTYMLNPPTGASDTTDALSNNRK